MRPHHLVLAFSLVACSSSGHKVSIVDAPPGSIDAPTSVDAPAAVDAPPDAPAIPDGIAEARAAADGTGLTLAIHHVTVTYVKPLVGNPTNDPAGFTIQATKAGPALFVSVDPATLSPVPVAGDVVDFTIATMGTVGMERRAQAVTGFARVSQGASLDALVTDISAATDLVTAVDSYDAKLVTVTGTLADAPANSGTGFQKMSLQLAGAAVDTNLQLRAASTVIDAIDLAATCAVVVTKVPMGRFNAVAEIGLYDAAHVQLSACPAPVIATAVAVSPTSVKFTFSRNILASTVMADGSQFTFDHALTATAAVVSGHSITVTTSAQDGTTTYGFAIATGLTDLLGSALASSAVATFTGFVTPAIVRINEVNANIGGGCDLIELRVIASGSMANFKITERSGTASANELNFTFPAGFKVVKNDFIVIHMGGGSTTCNPGGLGTSETASVTDQPKATVAGNYDTAYDFWMTDAGLVATNNVITVFDAAGAITDAVVLVDVATATTAANTNTAAAAAGAAGQWLPVITTYADDMLRGIAVVGLSGTGGTGTTAVGTSIQRLGDTDANTAADWTTVGAFAASTWGALNAGQAAL